MSPRTPATVLAGTLVSVMLFGAMERMVRGPDAAPWPTAVPLDPPFRTVRSEAPPPERRRELPRAPDRARRPPPPAAALIATDDPTARADALVAIPFAPRPPRFEPDGLPDGVLGGEPGRRPAVGGDGCGAPAPRVLITPEYPRAQRAAGVEGEVEVELSVGPDGRVGSVRVLRSTPRGAFDAATLRAVKRWSFQARGADCGAGATTVREVVRYRLEGIEE